MRFLGKMFVVGSLAVSLLGSSVSALEIESSKVRDKNTYASVSLVFEDESGSIVGGLHETYEWFDVDTNKAIPFKDLFTYNELLSDVTAPFGYVVEDVDEFEEFLSLYGRKKAGATQLVVKIPVLKVK